MGYITATFLGRNYSIPEDILLYIDLLDFTSSIKTRLTNTFVRKLKGEIQNGKAYIDDRDLAPVIEQQVSQFIAKLTDCDIYDRTVSDYLRQNEGYKLISKINAAAREDSQREHDRQMSDWREGHENAIQKKDASVTGLSFSVISGRFINHAIYAAMEASEINKQEKAATKEYEKEVAELNARLKNRKATHLKWYTETIYIPKMEAAITVFSYELLDTFISDLIKYGKLNKEVLNYTHIDRSNDLLKNLELSQNKPAVLLKAFEACPYNIAVYMQAMKHDLLDYASFQTATAFKQDQLILSFFRENWGKASFPNTFKINYHCIGVWASLINKQPSELLCELTSQYAENIVQAYTRVAEILTSQQLCRKIMKDCGEDEILKGDTVCKTKAYSYVSSIVSPVIWSQLVEKCGHADLLDRIKGCIPSSVTVSSKNEIDKYLVRALFNVFANERRFLVNEIEKQKELEARKKAEQERMERERKKRNIKITAIITPIIVIAIAFVFFLNTVIIPNNKYNKAISLQEAGDYREAIELYNSLGDYKDATEKCIDLWGYITVRDTVSAGHSFTVALKNNGTCVAAGDDDWGETDVSGWRDIVAVSAGTNYTLGLRSDGTVLVVGNNADDACNVGDWSRIVSIAAGDNHSVGLRADGTVVAVGYNKYDQCDVSGWNNIIAIAAGEYHTVGLKSDGTVVYTGKDKYQYDFDNWTDIVAISAPAHSSYTVGLKADGTVVMEGSMRHSYYNDEIEAWTNIVSISANIDHIVGLRADGTVVAIGDDDDGKLNVSGWRNIVAITTGYNHTVGLSADGTVVATGRNDDGECNVSNWDDIRLPSSVETQNKTDEPTSESEYDEALTWYNIEFASSFLGKELNADGSLSMGLGDYETISNDMYLFNIPGRFSHGWSAADADPIILDILDWVTTKSVDDFNKILNPLIARYGNDYRVQHYADAAGDAYMWKNVEMYEYVICWQNTDGTVDIRWTYSASKDSNSNDSDLDDNLKADADKMREYASYIKGAASDVLRDYPNFEDDGDTYYQCEDQLFGITGYYKFEYFENEISSVRFTWVPSDWRADEGYVVSCLTECFGYYSESGELLDDEWICYVWKNITDDNISISYYIAEDEGEILIRQE